MMPQHNLPKLEAVRVTRSAGEVFGTRPLGKANVEFELTFDVSSAEEDAALVTTATYDVTGADEDAGRSVYYQSEVIQHFQFAGPLVSESAARSALTLVWPYVRQSVQSLAVYHGVPLRGVPLILEDVSFSDDGTPSPQSEPGSDGGRE